MAAGLLGCALLSSCANLDSMSSRATNFSVEVANAQNQTLLLNVMRAAHRMPMHFTEITTLTGTSSISSTAGLALPFASFHGGTSAAVFSPSATVSQTPAFNVAVLETQEFYKGVLQDVPLEQWYRYLQEGVPPSVVFQLAISEFEYKGTDEASSGIANNFHPAPTGKDCSGSSSSRCSEYHRFKQVLDALLAHGLSVEKVESNKAIGPPLTDESFKKPTVLKDLEAQQLKVVLVDAKACRENPTSCPLGNPVPANWQRLLDDNGHLFQIQKGSTEYRFCLGGPNPLRGWQNPADADEVVRHVLENIDLESKQVKNRCGGKAAEEDRHSLFRNLKLVVHLRSTEGILYYLGEIARCELGWDQQVRCGPGEEPRASVEYHGAPGDVLFKVWSSDLPPQEPPSTTISVPDEREKFYVVMDPRGRDRSGQVLRILAQLLALNRSAKDFPAPTLVPILSP